MPKMTVCYCKLARKSQAQLSLLPYDFKTDLLEAIDPYQPIERYRRIWRFSKPLIQDRFVFGKLGFIASGIETKPFYDEEKHDFVQQKINAPETNYVFWAIDLPEQILAFEIKPPEIKYQSFRGAFEKFLANRPYTNLEIEDFVETSKFLAWVNEVKRITLFKATLRVPNPNWEKHPKRIQDILRKPNADKAKIELIKLKDSTDSLEIDDTIINDSVKYGEDGYSDIYARGEKDEKTSTFDSRKSSPSDDVDVDKFIADDSKWKLITDTLDRFISRRLRNGR